MTNSKVTIERFQISSKEPVIHEIVILNFDQDVTPEDAINEAKKQYLGYPTYDDVDSFCVEHSDVQKEHPVAFLHEGFTDSSDFPYRICLGHIDGKMSHLGFHQYDFRSSRFAFVRNKI